MRTKTMLLLLCLANLTVFGANVGESYEQVVAEKGPPKSQIDAGSLRVLNYPDVSIKIKDDLVVSIKPVVAEPQRKPSEAPNPTSHPAAQPTIASLKHELDVAVARVVEIINQPVTPVEKPANLSLWSFHFHDGATRPDFNSVDIRTTQGTEDYVPHEFITFDGSPGLMWPGSECEFNPMTKYFYVDRSVPKKKLTEEEMLEVNKLYRTIGRCEQQLAQLGFSGKVP
jgi:hypothetical protein